MYVIGICVKDKYFMVCILGFANLKAEMFVLGLDINMVILRIDFNQKTSHCSSGCRCKVLLEGTYAVSNRYFYRVAMNLALSIVQSTPCFC